MPLTFPKPLIITPVAICAMHPCADRWRVFCAAGLNAAPDAPVTLERILDANGPDDTRWVLARMGDRGRAALAAWASWCALQVLPAYEKVYPADMRPRLAIEAAQAFAQNPSDAAGSAAGSAAWRAAGAAHAADAAGSAAGAAHAAGSAAHAAWSAAGSAAWSAAWSAAGAARSAAGAARSAARSAAWSAADAAWSAAGAADASQLRALRYVVRGELSKLDGEV